MRKLAALFLTALLAASLAAPALADMIWYPENSFIDAHTRECDFTIRRGVANSPKGYIDGRKSPDGQVIYQAENGRPVTVYATYQDWGCIGCPEEGAEPSDSWLENEARGAWVPLADLALVYDHVSLAEDYAAQLVPADRTAVDTILAAREDDTVVLWPYPNAAEAEWAGANGDWVYDSLEIYGFGHTYTDPEGHLWGSCYVHSFGDVWLCLDARVVSVREVPEVTMYPAQEPQPPLSNYLPAALAGGAVVLSAGALWVFYGKKKRRGGTP